MARMNYEKVNRDKRSQVSIRIGIDRPSKKKIKPLPLASEKQKNYMKFLGIKFPENITVNGAMNKISFHLAMNNIRKGV